MPHFIEVIARNDGHPGAWRAGRFFQNGVSRKLEVFDQPEDPDFKMDGDKKVADPASNRIGLASEAAINKDQRLTIRSTVFKDGGASQAAMKEAGAQARQLAGELADARVEIAALKARISELEADAEAKAKGGKKDEAPKGDESSDGPKAKAKGGK